MNVYFNRAQTFFGTALNDYVKAGAHKTLPAP